MVLRNILRALLRVVRLALLGLRSFLRALNRTLVHLTVALLMTSVVRRAIVTWSVPAVITA